METRRRDDERREIKIEREVVKGFQRAEKERVCVYATSLAKFKVAVPEHSRPGAPRFVPELRDDLENALLPVFGLRSSLSSFSCSLAVTN
eukprot:scaffold12362_cov124-Isochrysis_galbana.AAC.9